MDYLGGVSFGDIRLFQGMVWVGFSLCMSIEFFFCIVLLDCLFTWFCYVKYGSHKVVYVSVFVGFIEY